MRISIRLNPNHDQGLIEWIQSLDQASYGVKSQQIKAALKRGMKLEEKSQAQVGAALPDMTELLGDIRRIVDASLEARLSTLQFSPASTAIDLALDEEDEMDSMLDGFGSMFDDEEL